MELLLKIVQRRSCTVSIIYDALQKTQQRLGHTNKEKNQKRFDWLDLCFIVIIVLLIIAVIWAYFPKKSPVIKKSLTSLPAPQQTDLQLTPKPVVRLLLQGVFLSNNEKVALINNQTLHVGDSIQGKKVISISFDQVKLQDENGILTL